MPEFRINPPLQLDGSRYQSKRLDWLTGGVIFLIGLAGLAGFYIYKKEPVNPGYNELEYLLSKGKWQDADRETADKMWGLSDKWEERSLKTEDYNKLSCEDLRTIDYLWTKYSNQHFGFSIQRRIFQSSNVNKNLNKFMIKIKWGNLNEKSDFYYMQVTDFSLSAPEGQLPWIVNWKGSGDRQAYIYRIIDCGI